MSQIASLDLTASEARTAADTLETYGSAIRAAEAVVPDRSARIGDVERVLAQEVAFQGVRAVVAELRAIADA